MSGMTVHMTWANLAFLHWRVPIAMLRPLVPAELELDVFESDAWLAVTPFEMRAVRVSGLPAIPTARNFPELNVRTYVRYGGRAGVYFFSLDAASTLAVVGARGATNLPYFRARMTTRRLGDDILYDSSRTHPGAAGADLRVRYRAIGDVYQSEPGTLDHWLTERYALFVRSAAGGLTRIDIDHAPWPLQHASADIDWNTMARASSIALPAEKPHARFARQLHVVAHWPVPA